MLSGCLIVLKVHFIPAFTPLLGKGGRVHTSNAGGRAHRSILDKVMFENPDER